MATAGSIVIDLLMKTGAFETDSKRAEKRLKELQKTAKQFGAAVGTAVVAAGAALTTVTLQAITFADQIDEMSQRIGVSTEQLSGWAYAAKLSGTSFESLTNALPKLAKNMAAAQEDGSRLGELFKTLGVDTLDAAGNLRSVEDVLPELADRFKALDNETLEAALAMELFGRSGAELLEFLNKGAGGIKDLTDRAAELGIVIGTETAASAAEFKDKLEDLKAVAMALGLQVAEQLLPRMIDLVDTFSDFVKEGGAAEKVAGGIGAGFDTLSNTATILSATVKGVLYDLIALYNLVDGLNRLTPPGWFRSMSDGGSAAESFQAAGVASDMAAVESARIGNVGTPAPRTINWIDPPRSGPAPVDERSLNGFLENPTGAKPAGAAKKSEAEKEAERLQQAYDSLSESLERQQFMLGKVGEEAQVRYEIELGSLQALAPELQNELLAKAALLDAEIAAREEAEKQEELDKRATEAFEDMNKSILEQIELIGMSADEQEIFNALTWLGVDAESARGQEIIGNIKLLQKRREEMEAEVGVMDDLRDVGKGFLQDLRDGGNPLQAVEDALDRIIEQMSDRIFEDWMDALLGKKGDPAGGSMGGDIWGTIAGWFTGAKAGGGDVMANHSYLIGEEGPEMFVPRTAGLVLPADKTAAMLGGARTVNRAGDTFIIQGSTSKRATDRIRMDRDRSQRRALAEMG